MAKEQSISSDHDSTRSEAFDRSPYAVSLWQKIMGPALGALAAIGTFHTRVGDEFYRKVKRAFGVRELSADRYKFNDGLREEFLRNHPGGDILAKEQHQLQEAYTQQIAAIQESAKTGELTSKNLQQSLDAIEKTYTKGLNVILDKLGYETEWTNAYKFTTERFAHLGHDTRVGIVFKAMLSGGALLGSLFVLNQNTRLRHELRDIHSRLGDDSVTGNIGPSVSEALIAANENEPKTKVHTHELEHHDEPLAHAAHGRGA